MDFINVSNQKITNNNTLDVDFSRLETSASEPIDIKNPPISLEIPTTKISDFNNNYIQKITTSNEISSNVVFDKELNIMIVEIKDKKSGELIKTIPSSEMLDFFSNVAANDGELSGNIIDINV